MTTTMERFRELVPTTGGSDLPPLPGELARCLDLPAGLPAELVISEVAQVTGISAHTLRYYERIGLVDVRRDAAGRRVYDPEALGRVVFINRLRRSDMPIKDIARYLTLVNEGEASVPARLALIEAHHANIQRRLNDLHIALAVIDYKIATYGGRLAPHSAGSAG